MARPLRIQYPGAFYHVMCRGNKRRKIFIEDSDRRRFLLLLAESLKIYHVKLHCYVLMNNHYHLVIQTLRANLSEFMRRFNICYTGWFNYRYGTYGHLYQGRYRSLLVDADNYLLELSRYVHLNPVRKGRLQDLDCRDRWQYLLQYKWSSLPGFLDIKHFSEYVVYDMVLNMLGSRKAYQKFLLYGIEKGVRDIFKNVQHQFILGDSDFANHAKSRYLEHGSLREQPMYRDMMTIVIAPAVVIDSIVKSLKVEKQSLLVRLGSGIDRGITAELLYRYSGINQREIGTLLGGIDYTAVSMLRRRLKDKLVYDKRVQEKYVQAEAAIRKTCEV